MFRAVLAPDFAFATSRDIPGFLVQTDARGLDRARLDEIEALNREAGRDVVAVWGARAENTVIVMERRSPP